MTQPLNDDLQRQLMALFVVEAQEHLQTMTSHLLALERQSAGEGNAQLLADTMREAHSLKGAARAVNLTRVESLAHSLESLFVRLQSGELQLNAGLFNLTYQALDAIGLLVKEASGTERAEVDVSGLVGQLNQIGSIEPQVTKTPGASKLRKSTPQMKGKLSKKSEDIDSEPSPIRAPGDTLMSDPDKISDPAPTPAVEKSLPTRNWLEGSKPKAVRRPVEKVENPVQNKTIQVGSPTPPTRRYGDATRGTMSAIEPTPPPPKTPTAVSEPPAGKETVRVTTAKLDALLSQMGELQVTRIGTEQRLVDLHTLLETISAWEAEWRKARPHYRRLLLTTEAELSPGDIGQGEIKPVLEFIQGNETRMRAIRERADFIDRGFVTDGRRMAQVATGLEEEIRQTRMLPVSTIFSAFPRMVRDLAKGSGKEAVLVIQGGEMDVDRSVLEQIKDPLIHILRNCIDHGIETPAVRQIAGKAPEGTIHLKASQQGDSLAIEVSDDGAGVDLASVRAAAVKKHMLTPEAAAALTERETLWLIFRSGLSTSPIITDLSGRGVGLEIVLQRVEHLHGLVDVESQPGQGTRFTLTVPLTVATTLCLLVKAGSPPGGAEFRSNLYALPISNVLRLIRLAPEEISNVEGHQAIRVDDEPMMLVHLSDALGVDPSPGSSTAGKRPAIIVGTAEKRVAFLVDAALGVQDMVIKSLPRPFVRVRNTAGATILGTGAVVVVLNATDLLRSVESVRARTTVGADSPSRAETKLPSIMVADDSITTRTLEKNILEAAGYQVQVAADGLEAWTQLQSEACDLLVSDIMMPHMDGFELTSKLRADERYKVLPIILVTSLDSPQDRERGIKAGADAYIVKSNFDQESLLDTIRRLI